MWRRAVAGGGVVLLLLSPFFGPRSVLVAQSARKLPLDALAGQVVDPSGKPAVAADV